MNKPYVISAELNLLDDQIRTERLDAFREELDSELTTMGKDTIWVSASTIQSDIAAYASATALPIVSLDNRYFNGQSQQIGISRSVDLNLNDSDYRPRVGYPSIVSQLAAVAAVGNEVVIVDDVLFSGEMLSWLQSRLDEVGVKIAAVICGIAIQEGVDKLQGVGIDVNAGTVFQDVEDELCERDFAFVRGSGRRMAAQDMNALYFDDVFGRPDKWASLPATETKKFCICSLERNIRLLRDDVSAQATGLFYGYDCTKPVKEQLRIRLEAAQ